MSKNLRNVAIPGTGIPLSLYCSFKAMTYFFILVVNPALCLMAAINLQRKHGRYDVIDSGVNCAFNRSTRLFMSNAGLMFGSE